MSHSDSTMCLGDCLRAALGGAEKVAMWFHEAHENVRVVHGLVTGTGGEIEGHVYGHAWVECRGLVADFSRSSSDPVIVPAQLYYIAGRVDVASRVSYSLAEARRLAVESGHYGPWEDFLKQQWVPEALQSHYDRAQTACEMEF